MRVTNIGMTHNVFEEAGILFEGIPTLGLVSLIILYNNYRFYYNCYVCGNSIKYTNMELNASSIG